MEIICLMVGPAQAASDPALLAGACATCHGAALAGAGVMPALTGKSAADLIAGLTAFRDGTAFRGGTAPATTMTRLVKPLSNGEIAAQAAVLVTESGDLWIADPSRRTALIFGAAALSLPFSRPAAAATAGRVVIIGGGFRRASRALRRIAPEVKVTLVDARQVNPETLMPPAFATQSLTRVGTAHRGQTIYSAPVVEDGALVHPEGRVNQGRALMGAEPSAHDSREMPALTA